VQLGVVGLGRMGANIVRRLIRDGHECLVFDVNADAVAALADEGAIATGSLAELAAGLTRPRAVWVMVPAAVTGRVVEDLAEVLERGDTILDGGNSLYRDDVSRAETLASCGIAYVDVGTSGGVFGLERGFCLMIGGEDEPVERLDPIFRSLAPGTGTADPTPKRSAGRSTAHEGYLHCGPHGAGHFVKMVHNGIEYGLMAAYAEGLNLLQKADRGTRDNQDDSETAPLRDPEAFHYDIDVGEVAEVWRRGSVVASWLLDLTAAALAESPQLDGFAGRVSDSGEGRWTIEAAIEVGAPVHVLAAALFERFASRGEAVWGDRLLSAMRRQFGGHAEGPGAAGGD
jgi:6-phosphogluconate dehydrogenase